jgi:SAM-dependent methyltransferase
MQITKYLNRCLCCGERNLELVLDLNKQPLANSYLQDRNHPQDEFPLAINYCNDCTHIQLTEAVDPDLLFKNYLYVSGTTQTLKQYFKDFVDIVARYNSGKKVLDIACNDGTQLDAFKERGYETYGIDPAENLHALSSKNHNVICDYFNESSILKFDDYRDKFDVVIAQNVFAHNSYPKEFLECCKKVLSHTGHLFIQTSQAEMVSENQFDTIYHEHISFFSINSMRNLVRRAGLYIKDVIKTPVHGSSFVFVLSKWGPDNSSQFLSRDNLLTPFRMKQYALNCIGIAAETRGVINALRQLGHTVIGYGAAAKGNTFINFSKFSLDYIVDDNPLKHYLYTPGSRIPILPPETIKKERKHIYVVPLAWNFFDEIKNKVSSMNKDVTYIKYFPTVELINA